MEWVLITGANSSLGFSVARHLASKFNLLLSVRHDKKFESKYQELKSINPNVILWNCDFSTEDVKKSLKEILEKNTIKINHFAHLSGIFDVMPLRLLKTDGIEKSFKVNIYSAIEISSLLAHKMYRDELKNIIFVSSISSIRGKLGYSLYASAKSSLHGLSKTLSVELSPTKVNTIVLGPVKTERTNDILKDKEAYLNEHIPLGVANDKVLNPWFDFLFTQDTWMTGQEIIIDGGATVL